MKKCEYLDLLVNGTPLSSFNGSSLLDYTVGETPLTVDTFQGVNRTSWNLLKSRFGLRSITITIIFRGKTLHEAKIQRSKFNSLAASGKVELFIPGDGFFYDAYVESLGAEELVGVDDSDAAIKSKYVFQGIRRDALRSETLPAGATMLCMSTMPFTDCRMTAQLPADPHLPTLQRSGASISFDNASGYYFANPLRVTIPASLAGKSVVTLTQTGGGDTRRTAVPLGKTVYGGSVEVVSGELRETHAHAVYDPHNIPVGLKNAVQEGATRHVVRGLGTATPFTFETEIGQFPISVRFYCSATEGTPGISDVNFYQFSQVVFNRPDGTSRAVPLGESVYGGVFDPISGYFTVATYYPAYAGEALIGPWMSSDGNSDDVSAPTTGAAVLDFGKSAYTIRFSAEQEILTVYGTNTFDAHVVAEGMTMYAPFNGQYFTGSLPSSVLTAGNGLESGKAVVYPLAAPGVSNIARSTVSLIKAASVTMTTDTGTITTTLSSALPDVVSLAGVLFHGAAFGDVLTADGITGAVEKNGVNAAATAEWLHLPSLTPGENVVDAQIGTVTVEYYPTYI